MEGEEAVSITAVAGGKSSRASVAWRHRCCLETHRRHRHRGFARDCHLELLSELLPGRFGVAAALFCYLSSSFVCCMSLLSCRECCESDQRLSLWLSLVPG
ncbi:uncharacterized protein LOC130932553 [Arachis stenosperma]|uniref:uncharacterized protein LOC130932553 n=1 Tax=Arachis stenosperma TaxID=217475 RepID=UPI0025ACCE24|nr:uncharacterized protein LOC130932553 [Arachis stenosperma]